nr:MAG TPA: hypothetical protein [Caudoviricetes sp.]
MCNFDFLKFKNRVRLYLHLPNSTYKVWQSCALRYHIATIPTPKGIVVRFIYKI